MRKRISLAAVLFVLSFPLLADAGTGSLSYRLKLPDMDGRPSINWGKDPFVPAMAAAVGRQSADFKLTAVFYDSRNPSAIVNDRIVYRGSHIAGQKVIDIGVTHVILQGDRGRLRLELSDIPELHDANKKD